MLENRIFHFVPKTPYKSIAEAAIAAEANLTFPNWCPILVSDPAVQGVVRTVWEILL